MSDTSEREHEHEHGEHVDLSAVRYFVQYVDRDRLERLAAERGSEDAVDPIDYCVSESAPSLLVAISRAKSISRRTATAEVSVRERVGLREDVDELYVYDDEREIGFARYGVWSAMWHRDWPERRAARERK